MSGQLTYPGGICLGIEFAKPINRSFACWRSANVVRILGSWLNGHKLMLSECCEVERKVST